MDESISKKLEDRDGKLLAIYVKNLLKAKESNFFTETSLPLQLGVFVYNKKKKIDLHKHNEISRTFEKTCEFIFVLKGYLETRIYDKSQNLIWNGIVSKNQGLLIFDGWHSFETSADCLFFEIKNGPYYAEEDKTKLEGRL